MDDDPPDLRAFEHLDGLRGTLRTLQAMIHNAEKAIAVAEAAVDRTQRSIPPERCWNVLECMGRKSH